ncbi:unnamed protein product [Boreogadus saida]
MADATACTAVTHQTATESSPFASRISEIGGHLAGGRGAMLKGGRVFLLFSALILPRLLMWRWMNKGITGRHQGCWAS